MHHVTVSDDTFKRLSLRAAALNVSVDDFINSALDILSQTETPLMASSLPLTGDDWRAEVEAWKQDAESRIGRYPPGFVLDDSRETIYREREDAQL